MLTQSSSVSTAQILSLSPPTHRRAPAPRPERNDDKLLEACQHWHRLDAEWQKAKKLSDKVESLNAPRVPTNIRPGNAKQYGISPRDLYEHITSRAIEDRIHSLMIRGSTQVLEDSRDKVGIGRLVMACQFNPGVSQSDATVIVLKKLLKTAKKYEAKKAAAHDAHRAGPEYKNWWRLLNETGDLAGLTIAKLKAKTAAGLLAKISVIKTIEPDLQECTDWPETDLLASIVEDAQRILAKAEKH